MVVAQTMLSAANDKVATDAGLTIAARSGQTQEMIQDFKEVDLWRKIIGKLNDQKGNFIFKVFYNSLDRQELARMVAAEGTAKDGDYP